MCKGDEKAVSDFITSVTKRGFVFIDLPEERRYGESKDGVVCKFDFKSVASESKKFFDSKDDYKKQVQRCHYILVISFYRRHYYFPPVFGYTSVKHKEGFRALTGDYLLGHEYKVEFGSCK